MTKNVSDTQKLDPKATIVPYIEENEPLPKSATEAMPNLSPKEELDMRVRTIKLIADLNNTPIEPTKEHQEQAVALGKQMMDDPSLRPDYASYPNETLGRDAKSRVTALTKLGEIDGVDAFKKRTEVTVKVQPIEEVEKELLSILDGIKGKVVDVDPKDVKTIENK